MLGYIYPNVRINNYRIKISEINGKRGEK